MAPVAPASAKESRGSCVPDEVRMTCAVTAYLKKHVVSAWLGLVQKLVNMKMGSIPPKLHLFGNMMTIPNRIGGAPSSNKPSFSLHSVGPILSWDCRKISRNFNFEDCYKDAKTRLSALRKSISGSPI